MLWATLGIFGPGVVFVRVGTLEENERVVPDAHFFVRSKHPWITIPEGAKAYQTMPTESLFGEEAQARLDAAMAAGR